MRLIFEYPEEKNSVYLPQSDVAHVSLKQTRKAPLHLPKMSEITLSRHYTQLAKLSHGVNDGFYPLGSCTMKYNPKVNEVLANQDRFTKIHPLQDEASIQGCLAILKETEQILCEICGMEAFSFQPAAGAHGEFCGLLLIKKYHEMRQDLKRKKIIIPDSAHGTNPASASMAGFEVITIPSLTNGCVDLEALKSVVDDTTAGLMLTNPNTVGLFEPHILEITQIIHEAGGLCYYDGANLNAIMGKTRPGDMGFDVVHLNLHKTFSTPHGGGGPGSGPCGCKAFLKPYLPYYVEKKGNEYHIEKPIHRIGSLQSFYGNFLVVVKALAYLYSLGKEGIQESANQAVLNANYLMHLLKEDYHVAFDSFCMHEFVLSLTKEKQEQDVSAMDIAKGLLDHGIHPPTMYFPLIVHEALMIEPTETETKETLDQVASIFKQVKQEAMKDPHLAHQMPLHTAISRVDEVKAARDLHLRVHFDEK